jgi:hypothetical protein
MFPWRIKTGFSLQRVRRNYLPNFLRLPGCPILRPVTRMRRGAAAPLSFATSTRLGPDNRWAERASQSQQVLLC